MITKKDMKVPADVPGSKREEYIRNYLDITRNTGHLMLFAGDQKIEHLNDDFYGQNIPEDDADPEHLFRIASKAAIGVFAAQFGLISLYGRDYPAVPYLVKLNSKTNLVKTKQRDPVSSTLVSVADVVQLKSEGKLKVLGVGFTIYPGSEFEHEMLEEAGRIIADAHKEGLIAVLWAYPRGKAVKDERDPHLIAGACGLAAALGADFIKVNPPMQQGVEKPKLLKEAVLAAGRTKVICAGGKSVDARTLLQQLHEQLKAGTIGNATGRNIHQKPLDEAVRMANAISALTLGEKDVDFAVKVYKGKEKFSL